MATEKTNGIVYTDGGGTAEVTHSRGVTTYKKEMGSACTSECDIKVGSKLCHAMECGHSATTLAHPKRKCYSASDTGWHWKRVQR